MVKLKLIIILLIAMGVHSQIHKVNTSFGEFRGTYSTNLDGKAIPTYLGIPYAEKPINSLRFKNPKIWTDKVNDTNNAFIVNKPECIQIDYKGEITGSEDCLYLNIFVSEDLSSDNANSSKKLPVMIFIRGGNFNMGTTNSEIFSPIYLLNKKIILVTFNYRLNVLGFFSTGNKHASGNYGLKDMLTVLKWVNKNIAAFGGDPNSVTLFGNSAGAAAIHHLALAPKAKGFFHKIITMSGSVLGPWAFHSKENIRNDSISLARQAGCFNINGSLYNPTTHKNVTYETDDMKDEVRVGCMRSKNVRDLLSLTRGFAKWKHLPNCIFGPTLEENEEDAIITTHPRKVINNGQFQDIPWMIGVTADEGLGLGLSDINSFEGIIGNFTEYAPYVLEYQQVIENKTLFSKSIIDYYFQGNITANWRTNITQLMGDAAIYWPVYEALTKQLKHMKSIYFYHFAYEGTFSVTLEDGANRKSGVAHMDDVNYLFPFLNYKYQNLKNSESDKVMIKTMTELFTTFAKTGKPSANSTEEWKPYQDDYKFMRLGNGSSTNISMEHDFLSKRMKFWESLMKNTSISNSNNISPNDASFTTNNKYILVNCLLFFLVAYYL